MTAAFAAGKRNPDKIYCRDRFGFNLAGWQLG
jgi:hypothetical protein